MLLKDIILCPEVTIVLCQVKKFLCSLIQHIKMVQISMTLYYYEI